MEHTRIEYMDYYLPEHTVSVNEILSSMAEVDIDEFTALTKMEQIAVFQKEDKVMLLEQMIEKMIENTKVPVDKIRYFVCEHDPLMQYENVSVIHYLHKKFHMSQTKILPIVQPCATALYAMELSTKLLDEDEYLLSISINDWSQVPLANRFLKFTIMGDGISLVLMKKSREESTKPEVSYWNSLNYGITSYTACEQREYGKKPVLNRLSMIKEGVKFLKTQLQSAHKSFDEIEKIIVSNVRYDVFYNSYAMMLNIDQELFYLKNASYGGHANDVDVIRNLKDYLETNQKSKGMVCLYTLDIEESMDINYHFLLLQR